MSTPWRSSNAPPSVGRQARSCCDDGQPTKPQEYHHDAVPAIPITAKIAVYASARRQDGRKVKRRLKRDAFGGCGVDILSDDAGSADISPGFASIDTPSSQRRPQHRMPLYRLPKNRLRLTRPAFTAARLAKCALVVFGILTLRTNGYALVRSEAPGSATS